jgi:hypothetical protein
LPEHGSIDILNSDNAHSYWHRSDAYDMALDLTAGRDGLRALATAMQRWVAHLLAVQVAIEPVTELREVNWRWYVGLDADGTKIGDRLWNGEDVDEQTMRRVVGLFRLTFLDPAAVIERVRGEPVYLILAMTPELNIRMKPQNLLVGLPLRQLESVA